MRLHFTFALITVLLLYFTLRESRPNRFTFNNVLIQAAALAQQPYQTPTHLAPAELQDLTVDQVADIRWLDRYTVWQGRYPFQIKFWHLGAGYKRPIIINTVDQKGAHLLPYSPKFFDFGGNRFPNPLPGDLGYSGFRIHTFINGNQYLDEVATFRGGSYFRVLAKNQTYGLSCRGLSIDTAVMDKKLNRTIPEEFPDFTQFWLVEPSGMAATELQLYALLDSPSVVGAYQMFIRPGVETTVDVHATLFFRKAVTRIGLAPLTSMYLYGENSHDHAQITFHPELHDSDGLLVNNGNGEWLWRPLQSQPFIQENHFNDNNPRGFGLLQRDRDLHHYEFLDDKYEARPSAWITPHENWGKGSVQLIQLNSDNSNTDNVNVLWSPEKQPQKGDRLELNYTITLFTNDAQIPPLAACSQTLVSAPNPNPPKPTPTPTPTPTPKPSRVKPQQANVSPTPTPAPTPTPPPRVSVHVAPSLIGPATPDFPNATRFQIDFTGGGINLPKDPKDISIDNYPLPLVSSNGKAEVTCVEIVPSTDNNTWRVSFAVLPQHPQVPVELRCSLSYKGKPLSETWTYTLYPPPPPQK